MEISKMDNKKIDIVILLIYMFAFFLVWAVYEMGFGQKIHSGDRLLFIIIRNFIKIVVWTLPVLFLLKFYYKSNPISYLKLNSNIKNAIVLGTSIGSLIIIYNIISNLIYGSGKFDFNFGVYRWVHHVILIGFTEEIVFRGFILQKVRDLYGFWMGNIVSSVLFLLIHFPLWYVNGLLQVGFINLTGTIAFVITFGLLQGYILKRTNSLWPCMIIHSLNNMMSIAAVQ